MLFDLFFALVVSAEPVNKVEEVFRTYEPCFIRVQEYRRHGIVSACVPTTTDDLEESKTQMNALAIILHDNINRNSSQ